MATQEPVEGIPAEVLERVAAFLRDPSTGVTRDPDEVLDPEPEYVNEDELDPIIVTLRKERERRNWTQLDVARKMGHTSSAMVSSLESGKQAPTLPTLRAWAATMGISIVTRTPTVRGRPRTNFKNY